MSSLPAAEGLIAIPARALKPGMYVAAIDRPWSETPFALQGFHVQSTEDVALICRYCNEVSIDPARRVAVSGPVRQKRVNRDSNSLELLPAEFAAAANADIDSADRAIRKVFGQLKRGGGLEVRALQSAVDPLVKHVVQDSNAMAALVRIRRHGDYLYNHSLCNAVWSAVLGRHLGLPAEDLGCLALGASLVDVGMTRLDWDPLAKPATLSAGEMEAVRRHVDLGVTLVTDAPGVDQRVVDVVRNHHERFDGSGYPHGLAGHDIPILARIAGLVDTYDAMITKRPHAPSRTSFEAVQELWDGEASRFQRELVEQFIQAIGLFPTGAVVELNSGEVGIVVAQNESRRLKPRVMLILDSQKRRYREFKVVDLSERTPTHDAELWVRAELHPGAHGVHPDEFFL
ncbi:MAG: HD domain-containing phosphohydrolase [Pseudomonadales bacterium]